MNTMLQMIRKSFNTGLILMMLMSVVNGQSTKQPAKQPEKTTPVKQSDKSIIDSLHTVIESQYIRIDTLDSLLETEKQTTEELREQVITIDDYRKKLEANINSFKGENLKLNQSNRILIVFNSLVAILLIISLVWGLNELNFYST